VNVLQWIGESVTERGVTERRFNLVRDEVVVPGIMWLPERLERPVPVVLMGHGGSGHKRAERQLRLGRWFAGESEIAAVAIDGPYHGDRAAEPVDSPPYQERMAADGIDAVIDRMVEDWSTCLEAVRDLDVIDAGRVAYLGFSMGTRFGLPFVAEAGSRLRCAVLGKYGMHQPPGMPAEVDMSSRFTRDAPRITVPVLFHVQWDDELFTRVGQFDLFELLGSRDKQLIAFPGTHRVTTPAAISAWRDFVVRHLKDVQGSHRPVV
jgi:dienelactone hydrolase